MESSLSELHVKAAEDPRYDKLAMESAENLGGSPKTLSEAMDWLWLHVGETESDDPEQLIVDEVNFVGESR